MRLFTAAIGTTAFALVAILPVGEAGAQQCLPASNSKIANCYRQSGATCDTASKRWVNADMARFNACMGAKSAPAKSAPAKSAPAKSGPPAAYPPGA
jgi:hypothetical protein